jgi:hypothetical protein
MIKHSKHFVTILAFLLMAITANGQGATTSSMSGKIVDKQDEPLAGATIVATHETSGTVYGATANNQGLFTIQGMRPGGPYKVEVSFIGFSKRTFTDIFLLLGENFVLNADLELSSTELREVTVIGYKTSKFNTTKTGATTNISGEQMVVLPTINRSISDMARVSPYTNGMSFSGGDGRSTNFTVDGSNFNNNF